MKLLIFIILVVTVLTVDQPQINKIRTFLVDAIGQAAESEYSKDSVAQRIYQDISLKFETFKPKEEEQVKKLTSNAKQTLIFYGEYCQNGEFNPNISAYNVRVICTVISEHFNDLENEVIRLRVR